MGQFEQDARRDAGEGGRVELRFRRLACDIYNAYATSGSKETNVELDMGRAEIADVLEWLYKNGMRQGGFKLPIIKSNFQYVNGKKPDAWLPNVAGIHSFTLPMRPHGVMVVAGNPELSSHLGFRMNYRQYIEPESYFLFEQYLEVGAAEGDFPTKHEIECWRVFPGGGYPYGRVGVNGHADTDDIIGLCNIVHTALKLV